MLTPNLIRFGGMRYMLKKIVWTKYIIYCTSGRVVTTPTLKMCQMYKRKMWTLSLKWKQIKSYLNLVTTSKL